MVDPFLVGFSEIQSHLFHCGGDDQQIGVDLGRQQCGGHVLVDDGSHTTQVAVLISDYRYPAAAHANHDDTGIHQLPDDVDLDDALRLRRGHHPAPPASGVLDHRPPLILLSLLGLGLVEERPDRLGRVEHGRVVGSYFHLGDDGRHRLVDTHLPEIVDQVLLECVADGTLGVRSSDVHRDLVQLMTGQLGAAHDEPHLRSVAVGDGHVPAVGDELGDVLIRLPRRFVLVLDGLMLFVLDQGVTADGDDRSRHRYSTAPSTRASKAIRMTTPLYASCQYRA